jgi:3-hydroxy acid dehydrogenase/malonic semialdehyde reductase
VDHIPLVCTTDIIFDPFSEFKQKKSGHVINLGSIAGLEPYAGGSIYTATKHAVRAFTGSLLRELVNTPIRVTEIQPGKPSGLGSNLIILSFFSLGMVETEFSIIRFRGDEAVAKKVYEGLQPCKSIKSDFCSF